MTIEELEARIAVLESNFLTLEKTFSLSMENSDRRLVEVAEDIRKAASVEVASFSQSLLSVFREAWGRK